MADNTPANLDPDTLEPLPKCPECGKPMGLIGVGAMYDCQSKSDGNKRFPCTPGVQARRRVPALTACIAKLREQVKYSDAAANRIFARNKELLDALTDRDRRVAELEDKTFRVCECGALVYGSLNHPCDKCDSLEGELIVTAWDRAQRTIRSLESSLFRCDQARADALAERDAAVKESKRRDQKRMEGIDEICGEKLNYDSLDQKWCNRRTLDQFVRELRAERDSATERAEKAERENKRLRDYIEHERQWKAKAERQRDEARAVIASFAYHACLTGDCDHESINDCLVAMHHDFDEDSSAAPILARLDAADRLGRATTSVMNSMSAHPMREFLYQALAEYSATTKGGGGA